MAITKITNIGENLSGHGSRAAHLQNALAYIMKPEKTANYLWVGSNCGSDPKECFERMLNEMKDIFRNSKKLREQRESASSDEAPISPQKEKIRFSRRHDRTGADPAVRQQEYAIILEDYLNNPDFSKEAKTLIFDGWNSGDPIATIRNYAQASFDVEFMKKVRAALLKRN